MFDHRPVRTSTLHFPSGAFHHRRSANTASVPWRCPLPGHGLERLVWIQHSCSVRCLGEASPFKSICTRIEDSKNAISSYYVRYVWRYGYPLKLCHFFVLDESRSAFGCRSTVGCAGLGLACMFPTRMNRYRRHPCMYDYR